MKKQRGITFMGVFFLCVILVLGSIGAMKIAPAYIEFFSIKDAVQKVQASGASTALDIKRAFNAQIVVNNIKAISDTDLEISRDGGDVIISFAYPVKIHMFNNVFVCIDFAYTTAPGGVTPAADDAK
jgi:hypothetical protein